MAAKCENRPSRSFQLSSVDNFGYVLSFVDHFGYILSFVDHFGYVFNVLLMITCPVLWLVLQQYHCLSLYWL